ncbi:MAG: DUF421 domain-containing protein [Frankiaceae bacterium]
MEIVYRAVFVFFFLWAITRLVGKSNLGELSTFQLVLFVTMGDLVQQGVTQQDYSVTAAVLAVGTFTVLTVALSYANWRWPRTRGVIHGVPLVLVREGEPMMETMRLERVSLDDLYGAAREQGIERLGDIAVAVLEPDGKISFFTRGPQDSSGSPDKPQAA